MCMSVGVSEHVFGLCCTRNGLLVSPFLLATCLKYTDCYQHHDGGGSAQLMVAGTEL